MYLLLKSERPEKEEADEVDPSIIQSHPVMARLEKLNSLAQKLEEKVENTVPGLQDQMSNLVQAAALMTSGAIDDSDESEKSDSDGENDSENAEVDASEEEAEEVAGKDSDASSSSSSEDEDEAAAERRVLTEARFALRPSEIAETAPRQKNKKRRNLDFGDTGGADEEAQKAAQSLASTLNRIEQKSASRKRRAAPMADVIDETNDDDNEELRRGLAMMEEEFGKDFDKEDDDGGDDYDAELDDDDDEGFYSQVSKKSKTRKAAQKAKYAVAPKFPRVEKEIQGERALSQAILKNRGLVAHKSKLNRNPRVKKREQYRKAKIRRKGAVREVRQDEGHKYAGEETGIKSRISRSRKLAH